MAIARDRFLDQRRDLLEMAHDPEIDDQARINAHHLAAEIAAAVLRIYEGGPAILSQRHSFPRTSLTAPGTTGVKLKLTTTSPLPYSSVKKYEEEEEEEELEAKEEEK